VSGVFNLARWEWFKLQRRLMLWILLAILLGFTQMGVWGTYVGYAHMVATGGQVYIPPEANQARGRMMTCKELQANPAATTAQQSQCQRQAAMLTIQHKIFSPKGGTTMALAVVGTLGLILFGVLTASAVGAEYGIGTLRPILSRGTGRLPFLAGKYLTLILVATLAAAVFCGAAAASGWLASRSAAPPPGGLASMLLAMAPVPVNIAMSFLKVWIGMVAFITLTGAVTLLLRSTAAGMAICLVWYVGEGILVRLLSMAFSGFDSIAEFLPMRNISALTTGLSDFSAGFGNGESIGTRHASLVLAAYIAIFAGIATVVFRRRDIAGAAGS
jgi:ABC-type transport system involved in multi-copper enzyme maturation permease subunit